LILLGEDEPRRRLGDAVTDAVERRIGRGVLDILDSLDPVDDDPATDAPHRVAVWVGKEGDGLDSLEHAIAASLPILPVAIDGDYRSLPKLLGALNASRLEDDLTALVEVVLRMLGLSERERRVFISYRRDDTTPLADQLRHALLDRGFDVFIDRFSIEPGDDVQRRIDIELGDKAFVLVLESPTMKRSPWILHEIDYALHHRLSLQSVMVPGVTEDERFADLADYREPLDVRDYDGDVLKREKLEELCRKIEVEHASRLRRHREEMLKTLTDWLTGAGYDAHVGKDWTVVATRGTIRQVFLVTPRAPTAADLYQAHLARAAHDPRPMAVVAHSPRDLDDELVALNTWVAEGRDLQTAVLDDLHVTLT
jgi:hypothetical protein